MLRETLSIGDLVEDKSCGIFGNVEEFISDEKVLVKFMNGDRAGYSIKDLTKLNLKDKKIILHLCADLGSDSIFYQRDPAYHVIKIGQDIGVENYVIPKGMIVYGIIANCPCTEFSTADYSRVCDTDAGMFLVNHCKRIIEDAKSRGGLKFHVIENPHRGTLRKFIGKPDYHYQPWQYGSPWTKHTALWGDFNVPEKLHTKWEDVPKNPNLYVRPSRSKPSLALFHKSALQYIEDWQWAKDYIKCDADIRSMCCTGFAKAFYEANK